MKANVATVPYRHVGDFFVTDLGLAHNLGISLREVHALVAVHQAELVVQGDLVSKKLRVPGTNQWVATYEFNPWQAQLITMLAPGEVAAEARSQMLLHVWHRDGFDYARNEF